MMDIVPYLSGFVTLFFGIAFYIGLQEFREIEDKDVG
jgi:hypothetical protein